MDIVALIFSLFGFAAGVWACIEVKAMQRSTHRITMVDPSTQEFTQLTEKQKLEMVQGAYDNF